MIKRLNCAFADVYFIHNIKQEKIGKELNKVFIKGHDYEDVDRRVSAGKAFTMEDKSGGRRFFLWVDETYNKNDIILFLTHELMHIVVYISQYIGTELSDSQGEWAAYLQEDLLKQILLIINNKKHVKSKKAKKSTK